MKIISPYKDYCDGILLSMMVSENKFFVRKPEAVEADAMISRFLDKCLDIWKSNHTDLKYDGLFDTLLSIGGKMKNPPCDKYERNTDLYRDSFAILGFCGKLYYVGFSSTKGFSLSFGHKYHAQRLNFDYSHTELLGTEYDFFIDNSTYSFLYIHTDTRHDLVDEQKDFDLMHGLLFDGNGNWFYGRKIRVIKNASLSYAQAFKYFDAYSAATEITNFIGGILGENEPKMVELSDTSKIKKHGFDQWSFRKPPSK